MMLGCITGPKDPFSLFLLLLLFWHKGLSTGIHEKFPGGLHMLGCSGTAVIEAGVCSS